MLYLGCLAAAAGIVYPLAADELPGHPGPIVANHDTDDPLFATVHLPPGTWKFVAPDANVPQWRQRTRDALGAVSTAQLDLSAMPLPPGGSPLAVRVDAASRPTAALTAPVDESSVAAHWRVTGWSVRVRDSGNGHRVYRLTRGGIAATAWAIPTASGTRLLVALTRPVAPTTGGTDQ
jgi:hypothetical protein